jgi:phosphoglycolate phosphatase
MQIKAVIFDLDGTLVDSIADIADAMNAVLKNNRFLEHGIDAYKLFVGSGIRKLVYNALPEEQRTDEMVQLCFSEMMAVYRTNFVDKSTIYPGIAEMLDALVQRGIKMAILSNKADEFVSKVVEVLLPKWKFEAVTGLTNEADKKPNPKFAIQMAEQMGLEPSEIIFMGDSRIDMQTAANAGMIPIGVLWGFRSRQELEDSGAQYVLGEPNEFLNFFS